MPETDSVEKNKTIIIKPGSEMTLEQFEDLGKRNPGLRIKLGKPKLFPQDHNIPTTDPFDMIPQNKLDSPPSKQ